MKIKYCISALLLSLAFAFIVPDNTSHAFESVDTTYPARSIRSNMNSNYNNDEFHIPPHSDDSTNLIFYYPLDRHREFGYEVGRIDFHFTGIPNLNISHTSSSLISFVYTYDVSLIVSGKEYSIAGNNKYTGSNTIYPYWQSAVVDDWHGEAYLKFDVRLTYTNMDSESVLASFNWEVPEFTAAYRSMDYHNPIYYLKNIGEYLTNGFEELKNKLDTLNTTITNKFTEMFNQMKEEHEETLNGYDDTEGTESNDMLDDSLDTYQENEQAITEQAFEGIGEYTVTEDGAQSFAVQFLTVFPLVASMMQTFYQSASSFNIVISVLFTTVIASMVIGLFRFYRS